MMEEIKETRQKNTIPTVLIRTAQKFPERPALVYREGHCFEQVPYKRLLNLIQNFTFSLKKLGVKKSDRVALISENRPEWAVVDISVGSLGAILVPIHRSRTADQMKFMVSETEPALFIVSDAQSFIKASKVNQALKKDVPIVYFEDVLKASILANSDACTFIEALQLIPHHDSDIDAAYEDMIKNLSPNDTLTIVYTTGENGKFKGVQLSHANFISNAQDTLEWVKVRPDDKFLSILPLSHVFEKTVGYHVPLFSGSAISYAENARQLVEFAKREKPTIIVAVPRLFERIHEGVTSSIDKEGWAKKRLFDMAMSYSRNGSMKNRLQHKLFDSLVYEKVRNVFGGNIRFLVSGGAYLKPEIAKFFDTAGLPILEGYGLTETAPIIATNRLEDYRYGTVGRPLPRNQVKISDDGEILVKGPGVMRGYYNNEEANKETFIDGWLRTGDLGEIDANGYLKLTGKRKKIIVLTTGENVVPQVVEDQMNKSKYILQSIVFGDEKKHIAALVVPDFSALEEVFGERERDELIKDKEVKRFIGKEICKQLETFASYEKIKKFILVEEPFSVENGLLTADNELQRDAILKNYQQEIMTIYEKH